MSLLGLFKKKKPKHVYEQILDDPLQIEAIAKLAKDCGRFFEIIRPSDGVTFRFYKYGEEPTNTDNSGVW